MKTPSWLKDIFLLWGHLTYLPFPADWRSQPDRLPQAMRFLPLLGALSGGLVYGVMRFSAVMPRTGAAALLLGVELLSGGAFMLRDLMRVADGSVGSSYQTMDMLSDEPILDNDTEIKVKQRRFDVGKLGLTWGLLWILGLYLIYLFLLRHPAQGQLAVLAAPICARLLTAWLIWHYPAFAPGALHRGLSGRGFGLACLLTLLLLMPMLPVCASRLAGSLLVAFMGVYLFATVRVRCHQALDDPCYGAAGAWGEILFLLTWISLGYISL